MGHRIVVAAGSWPVAVPVARVTSHRIVGAASGGPLTLPVTRVTSHRIVAAAGGRPLTLPVALVTGHRIVGAGGGAAALPVAWHALVVRGTAPVIFTVTVPLVPVMLPGRSELAVPPARGAGDRARGDRGGTGGEREGRGRAGMKPAGPELGRSQAAVRGDDVVGRPL
jgi:hypothetical protein